MPPVRRCTKYIRQAGQAHPVNAVLSSVTNTLLRAVGQADTAREHYCATASGAIAEGGEVCQRQHSAPVRASSV